MSDKPLTSIRVMDVQGRTILTVPVSGETSMELNLTPYPAGVYFVTAVTSDGAITMKAMKR